MTDKAALDPANAAFLDQLFESFQADPHSVGPEWRSYFENLQEGSPSEPATAVEPVRTQAPEAPATQFDADAAAKQVCVLQLINSYRFLGHRQANLDPLNLYERPAVPDLEPAYHGLAEPDMDQTFNTGSLMGPPEASLQEIVDIVRGTYCGSIGAEYMHITATEQKRWLQERLEPVRGRGEFSSDQKREILRSLTAARKLEEYLHKKYVGQKRFSLEGGDSLIPLLDELVRRAGSQDVKEIVIGMAHRGRLNVLVNILGKHPEVLFGEFEGKHAATSGSGDVKYHQGFSSDVETPGGPVHLVLAFNPSHLEIINPVVEGSVRARQVRRNDHARRIVLPILIHGDAAFAGQGVVMETLNLSETRGYGTGGTVHVVVNNQIGFTTSDPLDSRSSLYCTDVAKLVQAPIFHVNGNDPEAVLFVTQLALDFRMRFAKDVVIDMVCYRRFGHNEADEPLATQPMMYKKIHEQSGVRQQYADALVAEGVLKQGEPEQMSEDYVKSLESGNLVSSLTMAEAHSTDHLVDWTPYLGAHWRDEATTAVPVETVERLGHKMCEHPDDFTLHRSVSRIVHARREMAAGKRPIDWGFAETLAYACLLEDGFAVRISGQDSERGTFFHRHAVLHNQDEKGYHIPLQNLYKGQPRFRVINSLLSEEAVLGFEFGYSTAEPEALVIWEAQFGDFVNGAQVVIDQFISSSEAKWGRFCGLTMLLPHGYDGQGPEHSSARLERFLQL
ncbi:MAG: 2-oxoglutarate dehydrogenase E1 component, partial [Gammaproteobacteria bacterium]